jgi:choline dehydrogenase-like flavoprotein
MLGRNLGGHAIGSLFPFVSLRKLGPLQSKTFAINTYYERAPDWPYPLGVVQMVGQMPFWREHGVLKQLASKQIAAHCLTMFYMTESPPTQKAGFLIEGEDIVGRIDPPHSLKSFSRLRELTVKYLTEAGYATLARATPPGLGHGVGVARMGRDPSDSVVDSSGNVHHVAGLYVADASALPSAGAVNTGLTIAALALRTADHIAAVAG